MNNNLLKIEIEKFDLAGFIKEINKNLKGCIEQNNICVYMRPSMIEDDVYVELDEEELAEENIEDSFAKDLQKNDRILYTRFMRDLTLISKDVNLVFGNGDKIVNNESFDELDFGDFDYCDDVGFIIKSKNGILTIKAADYSKSCSGQCVATVEEYLGDFESIMSDFVNKYVKEKFRVTKRLKNNSKLMSLSEEAVKLIEEFFEENKVICLDNLLSYIEISDDSRQITIQELYDEEEKVYDLVNIADSLRHTIRGFAPCGSMFYEGVELAKDALEYDTLGKEKYIEEMGKICYLEARAEDILERLEEIEEEVKEIW